MVERAFITSTAIGFDIARSFAKPFVREVGPVVTYRVSRAWGEREIKIRKRFTKVFAAPARKVVFVQTYG